MSRSTSKLKHWIGRMDSMCRRKSSTCSSEESVLPHGVTYVTFRGAFDSPGNKEILRWSIWQARIQENSYFSFAPIRRAMAGPTVNERLARTFVEQRRLPHSDDKLLESSRGNRGKLVHRQDTSRIGCNERLRGGRRKETVSDGCNLLRRQSPL